ncbi:MAG TPA: TIGR00730 family Rossman fold protein [Candidatus Kapabacteria bacterium]|nr:TIGR00730 family Rossman fold protein [Candidatus Kapabacteria bacterium]
MLKHQAEKAYLNESFLVSPEARLLRILAEYMEPRSRLAKERIKDTIVFFGSARIKSLEEASADRLKVVHSDSLVTRSGASSEEIKKELDAARRRAEIEEKMAHYYVDAVELARLITEWSMHVAISDEERKQKKNGEPKERIPFVSLENVKNLSFKQRYVICSGGGPGIMEAANKGATLAGGRTIGFNISLPFEQMPNPYISDDLNFEFHYFFMRKFWFAYLGKALVVFPGGYGTVDELFECLTLVQTGKIKKKMPIIVYGSEYWKKVVDLNFLADMGMIDRNDLDLIHFSDTPQEAFTYLKTELERLDEGEESFLHSNPR